jgi:protein-S-isoprenylcysteine O-methyltransferase Ste14
MAEPQLSPRALRKLVASRIALFLPMVGLVLFLPAGTLAYWQGWLYLAILLIPMVFVMRYLLAHAPDLLERRMRVREKEAPQRTIIKVGWVVYVIAFVVPGLDVRFGWSHVPLWLNLLADLLVLVGYGLFVRVLLENRYLSRVIEVDKGQQVISTGPYAIVRHPMYLAATIMYSASPLALGSYWALPLSLGIVGVLVARIFNEEQVLLRDLPGYAEYRRKTRYRLLPGVW